MRSSCGKGKWSIWIYRAWALAFLDCIALMCAYLLALMMRFDFHFTWIPRAYLVGYMWSMPFWVFSTVTVFYIFHLYHSIWEFAGISEIETITGAYIALAVVYAAGIWLMDMHMPLSYYFMGYVISFLFTCSIRFSYRFLRTWSDRQRQESEETRQQRIMVIGAGSAGQMIIKELLSSRELHMRICCIIDDNPEKQEKLLEGIPIVGGREMILEMVDKYNINNIIFAIPTIDAASRKEILNICKDTKCCLRMVPGMYQLVNGEVSVRKLRKVDIQDLLGRKQISVNNEEILRFVDGKVILVTGGGGSIGSELCRQIATVHPKQLIIFDVYENNAYEIQQELRRSHPELNLVVLIGSVRNTNRINWIMEKYRPDVVFHAAAHKHVPLMEDSPNEAIKNNVMGTYKTALAAVNAGVKKFVLISSDKAVNPTNIMGASKRLCEMIVQMMNRKENVTDFVAVRFGNVLGSNGSVIPLFRKQIANGGPVTVTDKRMIRYFMTIREAVALVLQAACYAKGGEIFVLDMGDPVKIDDMARTLIRLSGYTPDVDIKIEYTGLRPGEKLYEELLMAEEGLRETDNALIHIGNPIQMDDVWFEQKLQELDKASVGESGRIKGIVAEIVPTYQMRST